MLRLYKIKILSYGSQVLNTPHVNSNKLGTAPPPRKHFSPEEYTCIHCSSILFPSLIFFQTIQSCFFRTLFTGIERYTFVDPDYAFTDEEELHRVEHKQKYLDYIATLRQKRQADKKRRYTTTNIVVFQLKPETSFNCSI